jgi:hypothetical protein
MWLFRLRRTSSPRPPLLRRSPSFRIPASHSIRAGPGTHPTSSGRLPRACRT